MNSQEADNRFNRIIDIIITMISKASLLVGLKFGLQFLIIGVPLVFIALLFQSVHRFLDWALLSFQLAIRRESRKKLTLWLFLRRIK